MATANPAAPVTVSGPARALAIAVLVVGVALTAIATFGSLGTVGLPGSYEFTPLGDLAAFVFETTLLSLGFVLRSRRPANAIGWLFLAFGICASLSHTAWATMMAGYLPGGDKNLGALAAWFGSVGSILTWIFLMSSVVIRFPDGRPATRGEAKLLRWLPVFCVTAAAFAAFRPGPMLIYPAFDNPISTPANLHGLLTTASNLALLGVLVPILVSGRAIVRRYRGATSVARLQLRWFAFGTTVSLTATAVYLVFGVLVAPDNKPSSAALIALTLPAARATILSTPLALWH
jgi:hypothetical protein